MSALDDLLDAKDARLADLERELQSERSANLQLFEQFAAAKDALDKARAEGLRLVSEQRDEVMKALEEVERLRELLRLSDWGAAQTGAQLAAANALLGTIKAVAFDGRASPRNRLDRILMHLANATAAQCEPIVRQYDGHAWVRLDSLRARTVMRITTAKPAAPSGLPLFGIVRFKINVPAHGLVVGDIGTVVEIHAGGRAVEVEVTDDEGKTVAVATMRPEELEVV